MNKLDKRNFTYLNQLINSGEKTIKLEHDIILEEDEIFPEGITITEDNTTIDGNGHTIDAKKLTRIFKVKAKNVTLNNMTLKNGYSNKNGGAISYHNASNCTFTNCYANWQGGALYQADAINCKFVNCNASEGGSMYEGSAFGCYFEHSTAINGNGGGICRGTAQDSKFTGCSVTSGEGSAMYGTTAINCDCTADEAVNINNNGTNGRYKFEDSFIFHLLS